MIFEVLNKKTDVFICPDTKKVAVVVSALIFNDETGQHEIAGSETIYVEDNGVVDPRQAWKIFYDLKLNDYEARNALDVAELNAGL